MTVALRHLGSAPLPCSRSCAYLRPIGAALSRRYPDESRGARPSCPSGSSLQRTLLPFAGGYYLSYVFRIINAVISNSLAAEFKLGPAEPGFMTLVYFLGFVAVQLPAGVALDRYGPRRAQSVLLLVATMGWLLFASADSVAGLMLGRTLIGVGIAIVLMASRRSFCGGRPSGLRWRMAGWSCSVL